MGQLLSRQSGSHRGSAPGSANTPTTANHAPSNSAGLYSDSSSPTAQQQHQQQRAAAPPALRVDHDGMVEEALLLVGPLRDRVRALLPPTQQTHWKLLYSSLAHGKNFTQLVKRTKRKGPTIIVIHEAKSDLGEAGRVFGGYSDSEWQTVSDREHEAKLNAAAKVRSQRCEQQTGQTGETFTVRPDKQARQFFGSSECFVFTSGDVDPSELLWSKKYIQDNIRTYQPKPWTADGNANYLYLMDSHPQSDRVGLGMGSDNVDGVGAFAWFVDRYLSKGRCSGRLCPTFRNPRLSVASEFTIAAVEAYAVDGDALDSNRAAADDDDDDRALVERHAVEKALMELHGTKFYSDEPGRDEC